MFVKHMLFRKNYDAIVLSGGGIKGIAQLGAIHCLSKGGHLRDVKHFVGTSVGAILAASLAIHQDPNKVFEKCVLPYKYTSDIDINLLDRAYGVDSGTGLNAWISRLFPEDLTFQSVYDEFGTTLVVVVTNLNARHAEYFSRETTPDLTVLKALRMSCSVPLYFAATKHEGVLYCDGGVCDNFPIEHAVDRGCKNIIGIKFEASRTPVGGAWSFEEFLGAVLESSITRREPKGCTVIRLESAWTQLLNFKLSAEEKKRMFAEGYDQAALHMKKHI